MYAGHSYFTYTCISKTRKRKTNFCQILCTSSLTGKLNKTKGNEKVKFFIFPIKRENYEESAAVKAITTHNRLDWLLRTELLICTSNIQYFLC